VSKAARVGAKRGRVELRVAQTVCGQPVHGGRRNRSAESAAGGESDVIREDEQDIRRAFRRLNRRGKVQRRISNGRTDVAFEWSGRLRKNLLGATDARHGQRKSQNNTGHGNGGLKFHGVCRSLAAAVRIKFI
jgi:hypothetical protein